MAKINLDKFRISYQAIILQVVLTTCSFFVIILLEQKVSFLSAMK